MASKNQQTSVFSDAYKYKSTLDRKALRLHRRSIDWKNFRQEENNRRRNIHNISPLQEITASSNTTLDDNYTGKTPVKGNMSVEPKKKAVDERMQQLMKWKKEKELKKKLEASQKKPTFKVAQINYKDFKLHKNEMQKKNAQSHSRTGPKPSVPPVTSNAVPPVTSKEHSKQPQTKPSRNDAARPKTQASVSNTRVTRSQTVTTQNAPKTRLAKIEKKVAPAMQKTKGKVNQKPAVKTKTDSATEKTKKQSFNSNKVSMQRGTSFAPEDFTFNAPNLFEFKPLSPASSAKFLYPNDTATTSFMCSDIGKCSTPKSSGSDDGIINHSTHSQYPMPQVKLVRCNLPSTTVLTDDQVQTSTSKKETNCPSEPDFTAIKEAGVSKVTPGKSDDAIIEKSDAVPPLKDNDVTPVESTDAVAMEVTNSTSEENTDATPAESTDATPVESTDSTPVDKTDSVAEENTDATPVESTDSGPTEKTDSAPEENTDAKPVENTDGTSIENTDCMPVEIAKDSRPIAENTQVDILMNESRRLTRSQRRSLFGASQDDSIPSLPQQTDVIKSPTASYPVDSEPDVNEKPVADEIMKEKIDVNTDIESIPRRLTRSVRRSLCLSVPDEELDKSATPKKTRRSVVPMEEKAEKEIEDPAKEKVELSNLLAHTPKSARTRRTMSLLDDPSFQVPDSNSKVLSTTKRSQKKRRKTQYDGPVQQKSPEEWINLLKSSPMVEMSRRKTPKAVSPPFLDLEVDMSDVFTENPVKALSFVATSTAPSEPGPTEPVPTEPLPTEPLPTEPVPTEETPATSDASPSQSLQTEASNVDTTLTTEEEHDVKYFRKLVNSETDRLNVLSKKWEDINAANTLIPEEVEGQIRTVVCQAQLLISSKFKQFRGLIDDCEFKRGDKETTCMDLQGFWEMMFSQVKDVDVKFSGLDKLQANNWQQEEKKIQKVVKKKTLSKPGSKKNVKSKFAEFRAQMKKKQLSVPCETKVFDTGIFQVVSPVKSPAFHCEAGSPKHKKGRENKPEQAVMNSLVSPACTVLEETNEAVKQTPTRRSYVPVHPSPLLRDITPKPLSKRSGNWKVNSKSKRTCSDVAETSLEMQSEDEEENGVFTEVPTDALNTTPRIKKTPRRSIRTRRSVSFCESEAVNCSPAPESCSEDDWLRLLQPSDRRPSVAPKDFSVLDVLENSTSPSTDHTIKGSSMCGRRRRSSLKEPPSAQRRRRSGRRSRSYRSSVLEVQEEDEDVFSTEPRPDRHGNDVLFTSPSQNSQDSDEEDTETSKFSSLNAGFTPVIRKTRPSLLFTPPRRTAESSKLNTTSNNVATDILVSFTP